MARANLGTTTVGSVNRNGQRVVGPTGLAGTDHGQRVYVLACSTCGHEYGANGSDVWQRLCPVCSGSAPGFPVTSSDVIDTPAESPQGRNPNWSRDELILALDIYMTNPASPPGKTSRAVIELSELLNRLGNQVRGSVGATFRNPAGVYMKMMNLRAHDPAVAAAGNVGLTSGGKGDELVWNEFAGNRDLLKKVADAIRKAVSNVEIEPIPFDDDEHMMEAPEGRVLTRLHRYKERNRKLIEIKKAKIFKRTGKLVCEVCEFDFSQKYGERGQGFIEAHHIKPVHSLPEEGKTKEDDLALLCSNCHRMVHSSRPWLSIEELRDILVS